MSQDQILNLLRVDLLPTAIDEILDAAFHQVGAGGVVAHQIAGSVEPVRGELSGVVVADSVVSPEGVGATHGELADLAVEHNGSRFRL